MTIMTRMARFEPARLRQWTDGFLLRHLETLETHHPEWLIMRIIAEAERRGW